MAPTVEELQAEVSKRDEQIRGMGTRLRAFEKVTKELGDAVEYDPYGNPMSIRTEQEPPPRSTPNNSSEKPYGHALGFLQQYAPDGWTPQHADEHVMGIIQKQGFLTKAQWEQYRQQQQEEMWQIAEAASWQNTRLSRTLDRTFSAKDKEGKLKYPDLDKWDSPLTKRTLELLQKNKWGDPLKDAKSWEDVRYREIDGLSNAAELARFQLAEEQAAQQASTQAATQTGQAAQAAAGMAAGPATTSAASTGGRPDLTTMSTEDVWNTVDRSTAGGAASPSA